MCLVKLSTGGRSVGSSAESTDLSRLLRSVASQEVRRNEEVKTNVSKPERITAKKAWLIQLKSLEDSKLLLRISHLHSYLSLLILIAYSLSWVPKILSIINIVEKASTYTWLNNR